MTPKRASGLGESKDVQKLCHEELRREIAISIEQADRGDIALLNVENIKAEVRQKLKNKFRVKAAKSRKRY